MENIMFRTARNLKNLREQSGLSQSNIAKYLGVDQSLISKYESNERSITSDMLDKLAALFGVTTESLNKEVTPTYQISFALRAKELNGEDLETISAVNRIALNLNFMTQLLEGHKNG